MTDGPSPGQSQVNRPFKKPDVRSSAISGRTEHELLGLKYLSSSPLQPSGRPAESYLYGSEFMQLDVTPQVQR